ncbi:MAG: phosphoribosylamine--glycine ligase [Xanthomonadales bacterium]|nr:phosphoribosylamine--glycine ligase [Xanthomonadales bacterium]
MKILVIGSGGREHALAWRLAQSNRVDKIWVAPGNAGTAAEQKCVNLALSSDDIDGLLEFALKVAIELTIVGPEAPLVAGIVDRFQQAGLDCFGPSAWCAQLEGSKSFAKDFMSRHNIPTAAYAAFTDIDAAIGFVRQQGAPIVVKADGLAAGKGVIIAQTENDAETAIRDMLAGNAFGEAGHRVVVEEFLAGEEASFIVMADGKHALALATSQDHKAVGEGDTGANTGGMGAYSPAPVVNRELNDRVMAEVIQPVIDGMANEGHPFTGFLYAGLMIDADNNFKVLEFNVRFGDPETQPIMQRLVSDLSGLCQAAINGCLDEITALWDPRPALGVVLAAEGYPQAYQKGFPVEGLDYLLSENIKIFHAGTQLDEGVVVTSGGRVLCVSALGESVADAQQQAYAACKNISWPGRFYRHDIGYRAIARQTHSDKATTE